MPFLYRFPFPVVLPLIRDGVTGRKRRFKTDAETCIASLCKPPRIEGLEHIPASGPFLLTVNHYFRPGFHPWWHAMGIASVVTPDMHWIMAGEWIAKNKWLDPIKRGFSIWAAKRIARVYGFTNMPPMPPRPQDVEARARAVRAILALARTKPDLALGLAPEGADSHDGSLRSPPPGAGRFLALLASLGYPILPVGAWEDEEGSMRIHFGPLYDLQPPAGLSTHQKDRWTIKFVMERIARLLPTQLRGEFSGEITSENIE